MENKRTKLLGMPFGTATSKLRKAIMFDMAKRLNEDICYRCGFKILNLVEFSIEHTESWMFSKTPKETFFDVTKIAFSHMACNSKAAMRAVPLNKGLPSTRRKIGPDGTAWCLLGKHFVLKTEFTTDNRHWNGLKEYCNPCRSAYRKERYRLRKSR